MSWTGIDVGLILPSAEELPIEIKLKHAKFDILLTVYHYVSQ
jgi:hypothetical protein